MSTLNVTNLKNEASASSNLTLDSNGRVGVGTESPDAILDVTRSGNGQIAVIQTSATRGFNFESQSDTQIQLSSIQANTNFDLWANTITFSAGGSERGRFLSTGGLTFNGDTAAANALDDYEKGQWTPAFNNGTSVSYSSTYTDGWYVKIGDFVLAGGVITTNSFTNTATQIQITLPFAVGNNNREYGPVNLFPEFGNIYAPGEIMALVVPGASTMQFYKMSSSSSANYAEFRYDDVEDVNYRIRWTAAYTTD